MKNPHLEMLSEMVRRGEPISMREALDVIEYQQQLKKEREKRGWIGRSEEHTSELQSH